MMKTGRNQRWVSGLIAGMVLLVIILATLVIPADRNIGLIFRQKLYVLPVVFLLAYLAVSVKNVFFRAVIYPVLAGIFLLPLMGLWNSGSSSQYIFAGTIPWSDAFIHHMNTLRFLFGGAMEQSSAIRPLGLTFNALILYLTNHNGFILYVLTALLAGGSVLVNLPLINDMFGAGAAALFFTNAFFFIRPYLGSFMTEPYGFILGMLSCFLLIYGIRERKTIFIGIGFLALSFSLNVRPSAMFVLATGGLWFFFQYAKNHRKRLLVSGLVLAAMVIPFGLSQLNTEIVKPEGQLITNDQAALYIYGLCMGGEDTYFAMAQPDLGQLFGTEELWTGLYGICKNELTSHPENILKALRIIWDAILLDPERGAFSYVDGGRNIFVQLTRLILMAFWAVGLVLVWRKRNENLDSFLLAMIFGIFLFQFVAPAYNYYRMRFDAPLNWVTGWVAAIGFQSLVNRVLFRLGRKTGPEAFGKNTRLLSWGVVVSVTISILIAVISPVWIKNRPISPPAASAIACENDESLVYTRVDPANAVFLQSYTLEKPHAPDFHLLYVRPRIHDTSSREIFDFIDSFETPTAIIKGIDLNTWRDILIFADLDLLNQRDGYVQVCGNIFDPPLYHRYQFMVATRMEFLQPEP